MNSPALKCERQDERWCRARLSEFPEAVRGYLTHRYNSIYLAQGCRSANIFLRELGDDIRECLGPQMWRLAGNDEDLCRFAARRAAEAQRSAKRAQSNVANYEALCSFVAAHGLKAPAVKGGITLHGAMNRMMDERWWRRGIRHTHARNVECAAIRAGAVHRLAQLYVSDDNLNRRRQQAARNRALLESLIMISEEGEQRDLIEAVDRSNANPRVRRAELMTRMAGFEAIANGLNYRSIFLTITCPPPFHAVLNSSGEPNPKYDGSTPRNAQQWLSKRWNKARSGWNRQGIRPFGFRIAEPHHEGTPHWHLLLFVPAGQFSAMLETVRRYFLGNDAKEPGAAEHRVKIVEIDRAKGSATGYVAKYVSKNINGDPQCPADARGKAERVDAWAATWGIRQFQQIGGPPVTLWREMRRLNPAKLPCDFQAVAAAADKGDWAAFVSACGGPQMPRRDCPFKLVKCATWRPGRYGDYSTHRISAIRWNHVTVLTRLRTWTIERRKNSQTGPPFSLTLESCQ